MIDVEILHLKKGAEKATGVTVIIDVFRAFTLEACLIKQGAKKVIPVGSLEEAYSLKKQHPEYILIGERNGKICDGFDYGNSPSEILKHDFTNQVVVHTTSAGTLGLVSAKNADCILTGALVNAKAIARYIQALNPKHVSLVCMGWCGEKDTEEDVLCAMYLKSLIEGNPIKDIQQQAYDLRLTEGKKFFDETQQDKFPQADFGVCVDVDSIDFAIEVDRTGEFMESRKVK